MGGLICCICVASASSYGIIDKFRGNTDIKLKLAKYHARELQNTAMVIVNGEHENDPYSKIDHAYAPTMLGRELTAGKPLKWVTKDGWYLSIHFDHKADHLRMKQQGVDADKLPLVKESDRIFRNKIVDVDTPE